MSTDEIIVRPAIHKDCEGVKAIDKNIYEGSDRFYEYFHSDVSARTTFPYVAELNGKIIGYSCGHVIDDGQSLVKRESRVNEKYRGQAIMKKINSAVEKDALDHFPTLQNSVWTSGDIEIHKKLMAKRHRLRMVYHGNVLETLLNSQTSNQLQDLSQHLIDTISGVPKCQALHLLTKEIRFLDFAPEKLIIGWEPSGWGWTTLAEYFQHTDLFISRNAKSGAIDTFCVYCTNDVDIGKRVTTTVYCRGGMEDLVIAHLLHSIREVIALNRGQCVIFSFLFPSDINSKAIKLVLNDKLGIPIRLEYTSNIFEEPLVRVAETSML